MSIFKNGRRGFSIIAMTMAALMIAALMVLMTGCGGKAETGGVPDLPENGEGEQEQAVQDEVSADPEKVLESVVPPEDFQPMGEYEDETSQRANMTITPEGEEGHYTVTIRWGSSAFETTIWEFEGDFDYASGMLSYKNCSKIELDLDKDGYQQEHVVYKDGKGALLYYEGGFHWDDKKENAGKDCYFIKTGDLSDTIIEEAE